MVRASKRGTESAGGASTSTKAGSTAAKKATTKQAPVDRSVEGSSPSNKGSAKPAAARAATPAEDKRSSAGQVTETGKEGRSATATRATGTKATGTRATGTRATTAKAATPKTAPRPKAAPTSTPDVNATAPKTSAAHDKFVEEQRRTLLQERENYIQQASLLRAEAEQLAADREPGDVQFDEESGEGDSMNVERERDLVLSAQAMSAVEDIDRALEKMEIGTYGVCERCHEAIPKERLRALPYAALCVRCKSGGIGRTRG